jgi:nucleotide-binding universal stress UspA family protein
MAVRKVLVPYNFSQKDEKALHYVVRQFAGDPMVKVTLFHVYQPIPEVDGYEPSLVRLRTTMASLMGELREQENQLKAIVQDLVDSGFDEKRIGYVFKPRKRSVAEEIVNFARELGYDTVVLTSNPKRLAYSFTKSVHDYVISNLKNALICIIT